MGKPKIISSYAQSDSVAIRISNQKKIKPYLSRVSFSFGKIKEMRFTTIRVRHEWINEKEELLAFAENVYAYSVKVNNDLLLYEFPPIDDFILLVQDAYIKFMKDVINKLNDNSIVGLPIKQMNLSDIKSSIQNFDFIPDLLNYNK